MPESDCGQAGDYEGKGQCGKLCYGISVNANKAVPECSGCPIPVTQIYETKSLHFCVSNELPAKRQSGRRQIKLPSLHRLQPST